ncbi:hypothetical protein [Sphingomonas solaris]|uniref:hypothetical protein n=1 Tax=Alterirhizorhabdus solaris TaxID=2529389 RepID=UPI00139683B9|nr:hypothetical protein [Sphingomonas solaris]
MDQTKQDDLAGTVGSGVGRLALLEGIIGKVEGLKTTASGAVRIVGAGNHPNPIDRGK